MLIGIGLNTTQGYRIKRNGKTWNNHSDAFRTITTQALSDGIGFKINRVNIVKNALASRWIDIMRVVYSP